MSATIWLNGVLLAGDRPAISACDHGLLVGDGVFETAKVVDGEAFALRRHLERLRRSAEGLGLELPLPDDELTDGVAAVIEANEPGVG
ncbi:MAG TPA: aminotransferase class IV, partial [Acidimicrobiales bacterium]